MARQIRYTVFCQPLDGRDDALQVGASVYTFCRARKLAIAQARRNTPQAKDFCILVDVGDHDSRRGAIVWHTVDRISYTRLQLLAEGAR
jgi:hypothetical protein